MSGTSTSGTNGTVVISGPDVVQTSDFYVKAGILHPVTIGSIAVIALFTYLRLGSNRSIAPITIFDWLINVALGSTLAGIVNGNSLVRGLLSLGTMLGFQFITSTMACRFNGHLSWLFQSPPLVIAFRGMMLTKVMKKHRISHTDLNAALRAQNVVNICQVDVRSSNPMVQSPCSPLKSWKTRKCRQMCCWRCQHTKHLLMRKTDWEGSDLRRQNRKTRRRVLSLRKRTALAVTWTRSQRRLLEVERSICSSRLEVESWRRYLALLHRYIPARGCRQRPSDTRTSYGSSHKMLVCEA